jgi:tetratricopeptide (TPR) repeat protein
MNQLSNSTDEQSPKFNHLGKYLGRFHGFLSHLFGYWKRKRLRNEEFIAEFEEFEAYGGDAAKNTYHYDIMKVGDEYEIAKVYERRGDREKAIKHYQLAVDNYQYADNEYLLSPDSSYQITSDDGSTETVPSVNSMVRKSYKKLRKLRKKGTKDRRDYESDLL